MYVGIRRIHELIPGQAASLGHNPTVKHETTRMVVLVQPVPFVPRKNDYYQSNRARPPTTGGGCPTAQSPFFIPRTR